MLTAAPHPPRHAGASRQSGRSSGVEHNLAKVGVEGSNPFARSKFSATNLQSHLRKPTTCASLQLGMTMKISAILISLAFSIAWMKFGNKAVVAALGGCFAMAAIAYLMGAFESLSR